LHRNKKTKDILKKIEKRIDDAVKEAHLDKIKGRDKEINGKIYKIIGTGFTMVADSLSPNDTLETLDERLSKKLSDYKDAREITKILTEGGEKNVNEASFGQTGLQERGRNGESSGQTSIHPTTAKGTGGIGGKMEPSAGLRTTSSETSGGRYGSLGIHKISDEIQFDGVGLGTSEKNTSKEMGGMEEKGRGTGEAGISKSGEQRGREGEQVSGAGLPPNQPKL